MFLMKRCCCKFEIFTTVIFKIVILWFLTPYAPVDAYRCFGDKYFLDLQCLTVQSKEEI